MFDELRYFVAIVEAGTYRRAAQRLHLTQPALSAAVTRLEGTVGARILDRGRRGASVTAAGAALLPHARAALAAVVAGTRAVAEIEGLRDGEVRLAAGATACTYLLPSILSHYRDEHPGIRFLLREASADEALENLHAGDIDIAVTTALVANLSAPVNPTRSRPVVVELRMDNAGDPIAGIVDVDVTGAIATFTPDAALAANTTYTALIVAHSAIEVTFTTAP